MTHIPTIHLVDPNFIFQKTDHTRLTTTVRRANRIVNNCALGITPEDEATLELLELGFYSIVWSGDDCQAEHAGVTYDLGGI